MTPPKSSIAFDDLLEHADWVRGLAYKLVQDSARADDLVQEAWLRAIESPPEHASNLRAWLGSVVTRLAQAEWRNNLRRGHREQRGARAEALPPTDQLVHEAQLSSELIEAVTAMEEPFKTVLLLRYFRDRKPAQIARELERPLSTVKTQLQRGLAELRRTLDARYGDRRSWALAFLPLARGGAPTGSLVILGWGAWVAALGAAAAILWAANTWGLFSPPPANLHELRSGGLSSLQAPSDQGALAGLDLPIERSVQDGPRVELGSELQGRGAAPPTPDRSTRLFTLSGRVLDTNLEPCASLVVRWKDTASLRWLDEKHEVITGPNTWVPISADQLASLNSDDELLESFARERFSRVDLALALLRGVPAPSFQTTTDAGGWFSLDVPGYGHQLELMDLHLGILGRAKTFDSSGEEVDTWFVEARRNIGGRVVDLRGNGIEGAKVQLRPRLPKALTDKLAPGLAFQSNDRSTVTDSAGHFGFDRVAHSGRLWLTTSHGGFQSSTTPIELSRDGNEPRPELTLQLVPTAEAQPWVVLTGRVLLDDGTPAPRATVTCSGSATTTNKKGEYQLPLAGSWGDLCAGSAGSGIATIPGFGTNLAGSTGEVKVRDLTLPRDSLAIEGKVLDSAGNPVAEAEVQLTDGIMLRNKYRSLEDLVTGSRYRTVKTSPQGLFRINGLANRDYTLEVRAAEHSGRSEPQRAGTRGVVIVLP